MTRVLYIVAGILLVITAGWYGYALFGRGDGLRSAEELSQDALQGGTPQVRERAALDLARHGERGRVYLRKVLAESKSPEVKTAVIQGLSAVRDFESMPRLLTMLDDPSEQVRANAGAAAARILGAEYPYVATDPPEKRAAVIQAIKRAYEVMKKNPPPMYRKG